MPSIDHQMTEIDCFIDDYLKAHPRSALWRRSPNSPPPFTDAEVLTINRLKTGLTHDEFLAMCRLVLTNSSGWADRLVMSKVTLASDPRIPAL
jgi:hypothetical protein